MKSELNVNGKPLDIVIRESVGQISNISEDVTNPKALLAALEANADRLCAMLGSTSVCVSDTDMIIKRDGSGRMSQAQSIQLMLRSRAGRKPVEREGVLCDEEVLTLIASLITISRLECRNCLNETCTRRDPEEPRPVFKTI